MMKKKTKEGEGTHNNKPKKQKKPLTEKPQAQHKSQPQQSQPIWRYIAFIVLGVSGFVAFLLGSLGDNKNTPIDVFDINSTVALSMWWMAPFFSGGGYCSEAIDFARALHTRMSFKIVQHGDSLNREFVDGLDDALRGLLISLHEKEIPAEESIVVCHSEPGAWDPPMYRILPCPPGNAAYKIGRTMFETDRIPKGWEDRCNRMDEIWVPTAFHKHTFSQYGVNESKIFVIPESVDTDLFRPDVAPLKVKGLANYNFLSIFKWERRKGWDVLLKAYLSEFSKSDNVTLHILTHSYHNNVTAQSAIKNISQEIGKSKENLPTVKVITKYISTEDLPRLYAAMDCLVIPSRGEGWGRPHIEAMSTGLPVIATNFSGNTHFMTEENSLLLKIDGMEEITEGAFRGHFWASPSVEHLRELMRQMYTNPEEGRRIGKKAREDVARLYSYERIAEIVEARVRDIRKKFPKPTKP